MTQRSMEKTLFSINAFRGVAMILVVLYHATQIIKGHYQIGPFYGLFSFGFSGVHMFFVLSGFIIYYIHAKDVGKPREYSSFLKKRFVRIYPIYWIILLIYSLFLLYNQKIRVDEIIQNIFLVKIPMVRVIPVSWTLYFAVFFYFLFSFLILNKWIGYFMMCLWVTMVFVINVFNIHNPFFYFHKYSTLIVIGLVASFLAKKMSHLENKNKFSLISFSAGIILFGSTATYCYIYNIIDWDLWSVTLGFGLASGLLMMVVLSDAFEKFFKRQKILNLLGNASYTIFLLHYPILWELIPRLKTHIILDLKNELIANLLFLLISGVTIFVCYFFYSKIEYPLITFLKKYL